MTNQLSELFSQLDESKFPHAGAFDENYFILVCDKSAVWGSRERTCIHLKLLNLVWIAENGI